MTDNEIVKALECCVSEKEGCKGCPYEVDGCLLDGTNKLLKDILALINRQKAEIERLKDFIEKDQGLILKLTGVPVNEYNQEIKSEAIKEFAERLKETSNNAIYKYQIDNLVKEMTEDENENH